MAEAPHKRQRDETLLVEEDPKRQKPYIQILSLLEEDEEEPTQDFSSYLSTLEREISSKSNDEPFSLFDSLPEHELDHNLIVTSSEENDIERESVMKHLLEASDDELGLPKTDGVDDETVINGGDELLVCDGLWELEDEAANYYTLLQSELFM